MVLLNSAPDECVTAQTADTSGGEGSGDGRDPCSNRVVWMSTGDVSAPGRFSLGLMGAPYLVIAGIYQATVLQVGYTPMDFLQFNASGSATYWSVGMKARLRKPSGFFRGLAIGADFGFFPGTGGVISYDNEVQAYNLAASFGTQEITAHVNLMQLVQPNDERPTRFPTFVQVGLVLTKMKGGGDRHASLLAEIWMVNDQTLHRLKLGLFILGIRSYGPTFVWDLGFLGGPRWSGDSRSERLQFYPIPYLGLLWFI